MPDNLNRNTHPMDDLNRHRNVRTQVDTRNSDSLVRQSNSRSLPTSSVSLSNSSPNYTTPSSNSDEILRDINRSVPDLRNRSQQNSFREAIVDRLINIRVRMQQRRINSIERVLDSQRRISNAISSQTNNNTNNSNPRDLNVLSRRISPFNRHSPYVVQSLNNNLRRSNLDSNTTNRSIDSIVGYYRDTNTTDSRVLRLCPVRNNSMNVVVDNHESRPTTNNIVNNLEQLVQNQSSNLRPRNMEIVPPINANPTQRGFNRTNGQNDNVFNFLSRLNSSFPSNDTSSNDSMS